MNQGKLDMVKQEMVRMNIDILGISKIKGTGIGKFNSDDHYIYNCGQESHRRQSSPHNQQESKIQYLGTTSKMTEWSYFHGKPFNITVIQIYAPISNAEAAEVEQFYENLEDLLELTPKKTVLFIFGDRNAKDGSQDIPGVLE